MTLGQFSPSGGCVRQDKVGTLCDSKAVKALLEHRQAEAHAEIVLCLEPSQLPHAHSTNPHILWEELQCMHHAQGFTTCMTFHQRFNTMTKHADQSMGSWIADAQQAVFCLKEVRYIAMDEDKILVLTQGSPHPMIHSLSPSMLPLLMVLLLIMHPSHLR